MLLLATIDWNYDASFDLPPPAVLALVPVAENRAEVSTRVAYRECTLAEGDDVDVFGEVARRPGEPLGYRGERSDTLVLRGGKIPLVIRETRPAWSLG